MASAAFLISGCSTQAPDSGTPSAGVPTTPPATTPDAPTLAGLTGGPVLAVKIDHTHASYPRIGIADADVIYVEPVEAGLTRLLAIFSTTMPARVGPVRSARESDVALLANYGRVAFAFTGASRYTMKRINKGKQVNLVWDTDHTGYVSDPNRKRPYHVLGKPTALLKRAGGSVPPGDVGLRFGQAAAGAKPATKVSTAWASARMAFSYDGDSGYAITIDGQPEKDAATGKAVKAANVIVQHVHTTASGNRDVNGVATPLVEVVGSGKVQVLRDGTVSTGTWKRSKASAPTVFTDADGATISLASGQTWVLLVPKGQKVTIT